MMLSIYVAAAVKVGVVYLYDAVADGSKGKEVVDCVGCECLLCMLMDRDFWFGFGFFVFWFGLNAG